MKSILLSLLFIFPAIQAVAADVQYGLRLDAESSLQWNGGIVYGEGSQPGILELSRGPLLGVWPGPVPGTFAVHVQEVVGLLIGDAVQSMMTVGPGTIVRSSRRDAVWMGHTEHTTTGPRARILEMKGTTTGRRVADAPGELLDFDVAASGRIIYVLNDGKVFVSAGDATKEVPLPGIASGVKPIRVFVAHDETELAVLFREALCRAAADRMAWECVPFDATGSAVVRQAWDGRVVLEPRASP